MTSSTVLWTKTKKGELIMIMMICDVDDDDDEIVMR